MVTEKQQISDIRILYKCGSLNRSFFPWTHNKLSTFSLWRNWYPWTLLMSCPWMSRWHYRLKTRISYFNYRNIIGQQQAILPDKRLSFLTHLLRLKIFSIFLQTNINKLCLCFLAFRRSRTNTLHFAWFRRKATYSTAVDLKDTIKANHTTDVALKMVIKGNQTNYVALKAAI